MTSNNLGNVKTEASYVINNAIQCSNEPTLIKFVTEFNQDLISSLCNILRSDGVIGIEIKKETLVSLEKLMKLDGKHSKFTAESSVKFMVDAAEGFESIEELVGHENAGIAKIAKDIIDTYYTPYVIKGDLQMNLLQEGGFSI